MMYRLGLLLLLVTLAVSGDDSCFYFPGNGYLEFSPINFDITGQVHYTLQFRTTASDGILLYSEGDDDYEALFLMDGSLVYLLANPSASGVGGTSGGLYMSNAPVNNNTWFTVNLWRNYRMEVTGIHEPKEMKTGLEIESPNKNRESHTDNLHHREVRLYPTVFVGGVSTSAVHLQGSDPSDFEGRIRGLYEHNNTHHFKDYNVNFNERVKRCS